MTEPDSRGKSIAHDKGSTPLPETDPHGAELAARYRKLRKWLTHMQDAAPEAPDFKIAEPRVGRQTLYRTETTKNPPTSPGNCLRGPPHARCAAAARRSGFYRGGGGGGGGGRGPWTNQAEWRWPRDIAGKRIAASRGGPKLNPFPGFLKRPKSKAGLMEVHPRACAANLGRLPIATKSRTKTPRSRPKTSPPFTA